MTSHDFVLWFKGFADAASNYTLTPAQWDTVKEQLDKVDTNNKTNATRYTLDNSNWGATKTNTNNIFGITYKQDESTNNTVF
jgi:hypothetical protein